MSTRSLDQLRSDQQRHERDAVSADRQAKIAREDGDHAWAEELEGSAVSHREWASEDEAEHAARLQIVGS